MRKPRHLSWLIGLGVLLLLLALQIEDWSRDFTSNYAEVSSEVHHSSGPSPLISDRSIPELVVAVQWAGRRIGGFRFVGDSYEDHAATVLFSVTSPVLRLKDDVMVTIVDRDGQRVVTASSGSRTALPIGDLGRNPRNLRRLYTERGDGLEGAARNPVPFGGPSS